MRNNIASVLEKLSSLPTLFPTQLNSSKLRYVLLTYAEIPFTCLFPYIHGHCLRSTIDFSLGVIFTFLANGNWTYLLLLEALLGYVYGHLPRYYIKVGKGKIDVRTGTAALICVVLVRHLVNMYVSSLSTLSNTTITEFTPNTVMVMAIKIGYLCRRSVGMKVSLPDWFSYCFTLNGSLSGMSVKLTHWYDWIDEVYGEEKDKVKWAAFKKAVIATLQATLSSLINLMLFDPAMKQVNTMKLFSYSQLAESKGITSIPIIVMFNILSLLVAAFAHRCMYYVVWLCFWAQLCGSQFAFSPTKSSGRKKCGFERESNINVFHVEGCITMTELVSNWNILAAKYWKSTIFVPAVTIGLNRGWSMFLANTASALWHGGRYNMVSFFWLSTLMMIAARPGWRLVRPLFVIPAREAKQRITEKKRRGERSSMRDHLLIARKWVYEFVCHIWTKIILSGTEQTYLLPTMKSVNDFMSRITFFPVWLPLLLAASNYVIWSLSKTARLYSKLYSDERSTNHTKQHLAVVQQQSDLCEEEPKKMEVVSS